MEKPKNPAAKLASQEELIELESDIVRQAIAEGKLDPLSPTYKEDLEKILGVSGDISDIQTRHRNKDQVEE